MSPLVPMFIGKSSLRSDLNYPAGCMNETWTRMDETGTRMGGFFGIWGAATSLGYNSGYFIEFLSGKNIQLNPFTNDFTPIEQTLSEFDNTGIYVY